MRKFFVASLLAVCMAAAASILPAQVTTGSLAGRVTAKQTGAPMAGVRVRALHLPSGTAYQAISRADGRYSIPGMRVGGPYTVTATTIGYAPVSQANVSIQLGVTADVAFQIVPAAVQLAAVSVTAQSGGVLTSSRTGAATTVSRDALEALPTVSRSINDFTRLTPQANGQSFGGQDSRLNNITVDGSYFNNSFGLGAGATPGGRTGVSPIPLDAVDQIQVNVAPFDVRQGNFVGAGVNAVTKSGTNEFSGSVYRISRNQDNVGKKAGSLAVNPGVFDFGQWGARLGGPIIKNKLFFFVNWEDDAQTQPGTTFTTRATSTTPIAGNTTRVLDSDITTLSTFLRNNFQYETGGVSGYDLQTPSRRIIGKLDFNANDNNKFSLRYIQLDSKTDVLMSNSNSLGTLGNRRTNANSISFENSNYAILENIKSVVGEWNSNLGANVSNNMILGYTTNDESREPKGAFFPLVDIMEGGLTYTSFGFEPFTPNNELRYNTFQFQNNLTVNTERHDITFGVTAQRYRSENVFFPGAQSVYVYSSLADFYSDANGYLANPNRTSSPVTLARFQVRYNNVPGQTKPVQPLDVFYAGAYVQDEYRVTPRFKLTLGLRADVPKFKNTALNNPAAALLTFRDEIGAPVQYRTDKFPDAKILWSPRFGFNWDATGDRTTQVRGGSGIFTGSPAYVWVSNQVGGNGILTGFEQVDNTTTRPFNPNPDTYKPTTVTGAPASTYELALTDPNYKFPQVWRSNLALDQKLPWGVIGTVEYLYNQDVNGAYYINANLSSPNARFVGADTRPRWVGSNRINANISNATVIKNQSVGSSYTIAASLEKAFDNGFFAKAAYSYGSSRNTVDPGSIAFGSWQSNQIANDPNNPGVGYSSGWAGHRAFAVFSYSKKYFGWGATGISVFSELRSLGNASYTVSGDLNGDGNAANDLIYIPKNINEMNFETYTASGRTFTAAEQVTAWQSYINQDPYLSKHRGEYAQRGAVFLPTVFRADVSLTQDLFSNLGGQRNKIQVRVDVLNAGNLINKNWGGAQRLVSNTPLVSRPTPTSGVPLYRLRNIGSSLMSQTYQRTSDLSDVWRLQLGLRYTFN
ncbi:MAG: TonB-dependent receptor [Gemmatimonadaceae bacterium]|nr:TonB-dependent receptor [Gemmatimonadaceae bacterium]